MEVVKTFDKRYIQESLSHPDWYIRLGGLLKRHEDGANGESTELLYSVVGNMLELGRIPLASRGPDLDRARKTIDTIVIHHTGRKIKTVEEFSTIGLVRQYGYDYLHNDVLGHEVYGQPVWSGHFMNGKQVFCAYHWAIFPNGDAVRLLKDEYIGWHAGNWEINTKSIGIALIGNFEKDEPTSNHLASLKEIIMQYNTSQKLKQVCGHSAVGSRTVCPGEKLIKQISLFSTLNGK